MKAKQPNIKDIARYAGVSSTTVSRYLTQKGYLSEKSRKTIENAININNYKPSKIARSLRIGKTFNLGLVVENFQYPLHNLLISSIQNIIYNSNCQYNFFIVDFENKKKLDNVFITNLIQSDVDGIIISTGNLSSEQKVIIENSNTPFIFVMVPLLLKNSIGFVAIDDVKGAYLITKHLISTGCKDIYYISGKETNPVVSALRLSGYKSALIDSGMTFNPKLVFEGKGDYYSGYFNSRKIQLSGDKTAGVFCFCDAAAYGVIDYCIDKGIKIPEEVSIAGFDNLYYSSLKSINLTTINYPIQKIGEYAAKVLLDSFMIPEKDSIKKLFEPELVIRKTTRA